MVDAVTYSKNVAALFTPKLALGPNYAWTSGGGSDSQSFTGITIDRLTDFGASPDPKCADVQIVYSATLGSGSNLSLYLDLQTSQDNSTWNDLMTQPVTVVATGPSGGGTIKGVFRMTPVTKDDSPTVGPGVYLGNAQRYVRLAGNPKLSRGATDTASIAAVITFGGFDTLPAPV